MGLPASGLCEALRVGSLALCLLADAAPGDVALGDAAAAAPPGFRAALACLVLLLLGTLGHIALCLRVINHSHSLGFSRKAQHSWTNAAIALLVGGPAFIAWFYGRELARGLTAGDWPQLGPVAWGFAGVWALAGVVAIVGWFRRRLAPPADTLHSSTSQHLNLAETLTEHPRGKGPRKYLTRLPGNQIFRLELAEKTLTLARLDPALDGLTIVHLSDLHFVGTIDKGYFAEVMRLANAWEPDLIAVTGDLVDDARYIEWIPETLGQLKARHGAYFVLGNHDKKVDEQLLRKTMVENGLVDLGSRTRRIGIGACQLLLAGNERPWFGTAPVLRGVPELEQVARPLRVALSHSPDQFGWARQNDVDLLLAGHTHGGQIQAPFFGPLWAPSHHGVKYASGTFYKTPTTMHVSRGISGLTPLRLNCSPELTRLTLRSAESG